MRADNQAKNKIKNRNLILKKIIACGSISRKELSDFTGLTKMTVTNIVTELCQDGLVCEESILHRASVGRNPASLTPSGEVNIIGIYLSRDYVNVFMGNLCGKITEECRTFFYDETKESITEKIFSSVDALMEKYGEAIGIGISSIGPVDVKTGTILNPPNFFGITDFAIKKCLADRYGIPVYVDNDMNTSAIAEKYWGNAGGISNYVYLGASKGIGAGVVTDGKIRENIIGEIGHVSVDLNGKKCHCGNSGCLEMYCSIEKDYNREDADEKCHYLAMGGVTLMNMFNPEAIFLGHRIPMLGDDAPEKIKKIMGGRYITHKTNDVKVCFSKFGRNAPVYGAIAVFIEHYEF